MRLETWTVTATSPTSESTAVAGTIRGLKDFDEIFIDATLTGATGGTLDVVIQRKVADDTWADWLHFPQAAAGAAAAHYSVSTTGLGARDADQIQAVAISTDNTPVSPVLSAGAFVGGHPGNQIRVVLDAGASTSAGESQTVRVTARQRAF